MKQLQLVIENKISVLTESLEVLESSKKKGNYKLQHNITGKIQAYTDVLKCITDLEKID